MTETPSDAKKHDDVEKNWKRHANTLTQLGVTRPLTAETASAKKRAAIPKSKEFDRSYRRHGLPQDGLAAIALYSGMPTARP